VTEQLAIASVSLERTQAVDAAAAAAAEHVRHPLAPRSERAYRVQWLAWERYAIERGLRVAPIEPFELVTYLQLRTAEGAAPNTVRLALAALSSLDQVARRSSTSLRADPLVRRWLKGWARDNPRRPRRQAPAITARQLEQLLLAAAERAPGSSRAQHVALYARDRAMVLLGVTAALRVGELVALDAGDVTQAERGLQLLVRRAKQDQHGEGHLRAVMPQGRVLRCPVDAWRCWLTVRGTDPGPAFVAFDRAGRPSSSALDERSARRIVTRRAAAVGLELVSSHSMRATFATLATERGKPITRIADQGNWRKLDVLRGYVRQAELFDNNPSASLLDD
jgi:integrase